jgi:hypothetical protein
MLRNTSIRSVQLSQNVFIHSADASSCLRQKTRDGEIKRIAILSGAYFEVPVISDIPEGFRYTYKAKPV